MELFSQCTSASASSSNCINISGTVIAKERLNNMSTSLFFSQLKTFCYEAEQDAKKLRKQVDQKGEGKLVLKYVCWENSF